MIVSQRFRVVVSLPLGRDENLGFAYFSSMVCTVNRRSFAPFGLDIPLVSHKKNAWAWYQV